MKHMECGVIGIVSSRVLGFNNQSKHKKRLHIWPKKFVEWYRKSAEEILKIRQDDLTQKVGENIIEYKNRAARFQKEIEKFHSHLIEKARAT